MVLISWQQPNSSASAAESTIAQLRADCQRWQSQLDAKHEDLRKLSEALAAAQAEIDRLTGVVNSTCQDLARAKEQIERQQTAINVQAEAIKGKTPSSTPSAPSSKGQSSGPPASGPTTARHQHGTLVPSDSRLMPQSVFLSPQSASQYDRQQFIPGTATPLRRQASSGFSRPTPNPDRMLMPPPSQHSQQHSSANNPVSLGSGQASSGFSSSSLNPESTPMLRPPSQHSQQRSYPSNVAPQSDSFEPWGESSMLFYPPDNAAGTTTNELALARQQNNDDDPNVAQAVSELFRRTEQWAKSYANVPDKIRDRSSSNQLKDLLTKVAHERTNFVGELMKDESTRCYLVTKLINTDLTTQIMQVRALRGFNQKTESLIAITQRSIESGIDLRNRHEKRIIIANAIDSMRHESGFTDFVSLRGIKAAEKLYNLILPIMHSAPGTALEELTSIYKDAYCLCAAMFAKPAEYDFEYPVAGHSDRFQGSHMFNRDPIVRGDPTSLHRQGYRVRLAFSPVLVMTEFLDRRIVPRTLRLADVLLRK